jgi:hypothetical protein
MQKKASKTVPSYKWLVEDLCPNCDATCDCATPGAEVPPAPAGAKLSAAHDVAAFGATPR